MSQFTMGQKVKHRLSNFGGVITAFAQYAYGEDSVRVTSPDVDKQTGKPVHEWLVETEVQALE